MCRHHLYEFLMLFSFRKGRLFFEKQWQFNPPDFAQIDRFIRNSAAAYEERDCIGSQDIAYALQISACVTLSLLHSCLKYGNTYTLPQKRTVCAKAALL